MPSAFASARVAGWTPRYFRYGPAWPAPLAPKRRIDKWRGQPTNGCRPHPAPRRWYACRARPIRIDNRVKSCVDFVKLRGPRADRLAFRVACRLMIVLRRCLGSRRPYGPQRTVQFLACTSPHPRNYAPAGAGRPLAEAREAAAGWLVALLARGCAGRRRRGTPQPARSGRSVVCPRSAPNHRPVRP
jgi:hypothetical protein